MWLSFFFRVRNFQMKMRLIILAYFSLLVEIVSSMHVISKKFFVMHVYRIT